MTNNYENYSPEDYKKLISSIKEGFLGSEENYNTDFLIKKINENRKVLSSQDFIDFLKKEIENVIFDEVSGEINKELLNFYMNFLISIISIIKIENTKEKRISYKVITELEKQKSRIESILDLKKNELESTIKIKESEKKYEKKFIEILEILTSYGIDGKNVKVKDAMEKVRLFGEISKILNELFPDEEITDDKLVSTTEKIANGYLAMKKLIDRLFQLGILEKELTGRLELKNSGKTIINPLAVTATSNPKVVPISGKRGSVRSQNKGNGVIKGGNRETKPFGLDDFNENIGLSEQEEIINELEKQMEELRLKLENELGFSEQRLLNSETENERLRDENEKLKAEMAKIQAENQKLQKIADLKRKKASDSYSNTEKTTKKD